APAARGGPAVPRVAPPHRTRDHRAARRGHPPPREGRAPGSNGATTGIVAARSSHAHPTGPPTTTQPVAPLPKREVDRREHHNRRLRRLRRRRRVPPTAARGGAVRGAVAASRAPGPHRP